MVNCCYDNGGKGHDDVVEADEGVVVVVVEAEEGDVCRETIFLDSQLRSSEEGAGKVRKQWKPNGNNAECNAWQCMAMYGNI